MLNSSLVLTHVHKLSLYTKQALPMLQKRNYLSLGDEFFQNSQPKSFSDPRLFLFNKRNALQLGLSKSFPENATKLTELLSGQNLSEHWSPSALAYSGHQFGQFNPSLGDGRAHYLGELYDASKQPWELQLKGSGPTPFSRGGDGLCGLGPAVREFIMSAALKGLGVPTTHSLSVVTTGEHIFREGATKGAIVSRIASSHIRVGTFQYFASRGNTLALKKLADFCLERHFPELNKELKDSTSAERYSRLLEAVIDKQIDLICEWMRVGFIHGVMNTDNTLISGDTIDFGPCAMLGAYDPSTVYSSIDRNGRYAFGNQSDIALWNLTRFAECLIPIRENPEQSDKVVEQWLSLLKEHSLDYTQSFNLLTMSIGKECLDIPEPLIEFVNNWTRLLSNQNRARDEIQKGMLESNPYIVPRNHLVELAIEKCVNSEDTEYVESLVDALATPYDRNGKNALFDETPSDGDRSYVTYCGT